MKTMRFLFSAVLLAAGMTQLATVPYAQKKQGKYDTPTVTCVGSTLHTLFLQVCAGPSGTPAGFSIQWVKHSDYPALTCGATGQDALWPPSDSGLICKASFSGTPGCSIYNLAPNACIIVEIGNLSDADCGVGLSNCGAEELECGTEYVFRAFAHANSAKNRSDFTANVCCATEPCTPACVRTQGYWETHGCFWPAPFVPGIPDPTDANMNGTPDNLEGQCAVSGNNPNSSCPCDPVNTILIGSNAYSQCQLLCNFVLPAQGNAVRQLSHQLIAAKLNVLSGASDMNTVSDPLDLSNPYNGYTVAALIAEADLLIGTRDIQTAVEGTQCGGPNADPEGCPMNKVAKLLDLYNKIGRAHV